MTTAPRTYLTDFSLANPLYANARLSIYAANTTTWAPTDTLAPLYTAPSGSVTAANPVTLDSEGKWQQPIYVDRPVVIRITGAAVPSHDTGVVGLRRSSVQSDWAPDTYYPDGDVVRDGAAGSNTGSLYICLASHTSSAESFADDLNAGLWGIFVDMDALSREAAERVSTVYVGTIAITEPYANAVFQRDTYTGGLWSKGVGTVPLTINPTQPVTLLQYRLRNAAFPGSVLQDWATATPPIAAGSQTIRVAAPAGLYRYLIDLRANTDDTSIVSTTNPVMVGDVRVEFGQSLAEGKLLTVASGDITTIASLGLDISEWGYIFASYGLNSGAYPAVPDYSTQLYPPTEWLLPSDSGPFDSAHAVEYFNEKVARAGVPQALVGYVVGGTGLDTWLPGYDGTGTAHWDRLANIITLAGGKFAGAHAVIGHYHSKDGSDYARVYGLWGSFFEALEDEFPAAGNFFRLISSIPAVGAYGSGVANVNMVRAASKAYAAATARTWYVDGLDVTMVADLVHPSQAGGIIFARHWVRADMYAMSLSDYGAAGPALLSATRAFESQDFVVTCSNPNAATAWVEVGASENQFTIYPAGSTSGALVISNVDLTNFPEITITTSSSITEPAAFDIWPRRSPDTSAIIAVGIYDNQTDDGFPRGRQLTISGTALECGLPVVVLTVDNIGNDVAGTATDIEGTYTNGEPTDFEYSLDGGKTWIAATSPTVGSGNYSFTLGSGFPVGVYRLVVRDSTTLGQVVSNQFSITMASPPTVPTIASPIFAMDMSQPLNHVFTDTNRTIQAAMGDGIGSVSDLTGTGNHHSQATTTKRPVLVPNVKNGLPGLRFTGALSQFLSIVSGATLPATLKASSGWTMYLVFTPNTIPDAGQAAATVFATGERAKIGGFNIIRGAQFLSTSSLRASRNSDGAYFQPSVAGAVAEDQLTKVVSRYNGGANTLKAQVNAIGEGSAATGSLGTNAFTHCYIGADPSNATDQFFFDGWVHEIRVWNTTGTDTDRDDLLTYALDKWAS